MPVRYAVRRFRTTRFARCALTLARRLAALTAACRSDTSNAMLVAEARFTAEPSSRRRCAPRSSPASPRSPRPAALAPGLAPRRALVPTLLSEPPAPCRARPPAVVSAVPATQSPWRLPSAGFPGADFPIADAASRCLLWTPEAVGSHTPRIDDALVTGCALVMRFAALMPTQAVWMLLDPVYSSLSPYLSH